MFEKVNPSHPDKIADQIAGAIVDLAYSIPNEEDPKIAVEVLLGHHHCTIIIESSIKIPEARIKAAVRRVSVFENPTIIQVPQDIFLRCNQDGKFRCGDNGIFKGMPVTEEQKKLSQLAKDLYKDCRTDGKFLIDGDKLVICQSYERKQDLEKRFPGAIINPLGSWTGGTNVDAGATNRKLGSDMGDAVTGGGLHGKDLSKADVSVNIYAHLKAQETGEPVEISCAIGDEMVDGRPYGEIVEIARAYIESIGGFEKFAAWGLI